MRETTCSTPDLVGTHSDELKCAWLSWRVIERGWLSVHIPAGHCTDMTGAIRIGMRLMPDVLEITVVSGNDIDVVYLRDCGGWFSDSGRWSNGRRMIVEADTRTPPRD